MRGRAEPHLAHSSQPLCVKAALLYSSEGRYRLLLTLTLLEIFGRTDTGFQIVIIKIFLSCLYHAAKQQSIDITRDYMNVCRCLSRFFLTGIEGVRTQDACTGCQAKMRQQDCDFFFFNYYYLISIKNKDTRTSCQCHHLFDFCCFLFQPQSTRQRERERET